MAYWECKYCGRVDFGQSETVCPDCGFSLTRVEGDPPANISLRNQERKEKVQSDLHSQQDYQTQVCLALKEKRNSDFKWGVSLLGICFLCLMGCSVFPLLGFLGFLFFGLLGIVSIINAGKNQEDLYIAGEDIEKYKKMYNEREKKRAEEHARVEELKKRMEAEKEREIDKERAYAERSQRNSSPWEVRYFTSPCPYCGHYKVRYSKWEDKRVSVAFWGGASGKIGKDFKCEHCGRMW